MTDKGSEGTQHGFHPVIRKCEKESRTARLEGEPLPGKFMRAERGEESCFRRIPSCKDPENVDLMFFLLWVM